MKIFKMLIPEIVILLAYVVFVNLEWEGLWGNTVISMTMMAFILNKFDKVDK